MGMNYKPLEVEFTKTGFRFKQLCREGDVAIFHKVRLSPKPHDAGFEVIVVGRHDGYEIAGNRFEPSEMYPSSEQWGTRGWTYQDLYSAEQRFAQLQGKEIVMVEGVEEEQETEMPSRPRRPRGSGLPEIKFPTGEFSIKEAAALNPTINPATVYLCVKEAEEAGMVKRTRTERRAERGKPTQLFQAVNG